MPWLAKRSNETKTHARLTDGFDNLENAFQNHQGALELPPLNRARERERGRGRECARERERERESERANHRPTHAQQ